MHIITLKNVYMKEKLFTLCLAACLSTAAWAQNQTVKGTVVDHDGEPVIGAVVRGADGKVVAVTDANGTFTVSLPQGKGELTVKALGLKEQK